jgi:acylphosphatase
MIAAQLLVSGMVQGVGYRAWTERTARALGVHGFVRNLDDGRVEIFAEADLKTLDTFVTACWRGPTHARVDDIVRIPRTVRGAVEFDFVADARAPET